MSILDGRGNPIAAPEPEPALPSFSDLQAELSKSSEPFEQAIFVQMMLNHPEACPESLREVGILLCQEGIGQCQDGLQHARKFMPFWDGHPASFVHAKFGDPLPPAAVVVGSLVSYKDAAMEAYAALTENPDLPPEMVLAHTKTAFNSCLIGGQMRALCEHLANSVNNSLRGPMSVAKGLLTSDQETPQAPQEEKAVYTIHNPYGSTPSHESDIVFDGDTDRTSGPLNSLPENPSGIILTG